MNKGCRSVVGWGTIYLVTPTKALSSTLRSFRDRLYMLHAFTCSVSFVHVVGARKSSLKELKSLYCSRHLLVC